MTSNPAEVGPASAARERKERIAAAIESEFQPLWYAILAIVRSAEKGLSRRQLIPRAEEVLNETVCRALEKPDSYHPDRRAIPWLMGIARNIVNSDARLAAGRSRRTDRVEGGDAVWEHLLGVLDSSGEETAARLDVEQMLSRLSASARKAIESRFLKGLDGSELAEVLGARSAGAARVQVCRALQTLRDLYAADRSEVTP